MLIDERTVAKRLLPQLAASLEQGALLDFELGGAAPLIRLFRERGDPGFLVARRDAHHESLLLMAQLLRWVGARCPSLSIMMTMHHHTVAALVRNCIPVRACDSIVSRIGEGAVISSAFAEGRAGANILDATVRCVPLIHGDEFQITGSKQPCSMTHGADLALVGVAVAHPDGESSRGLVVMDLRSAGIERRQFWSSELLAAADSHALVMKDVRVRSDHSLAPRRSDKSATAERMAVAHAEIALSCLFQLFACASYLGMVTRLAEVMLKERAGGAAQRVDVLSRIEVASMAVYHHARLLEAGSFGPRLLSGSMLLSQHVAKQIDDASAEIVRAMGGRVFLRSKEVQYLLHAVRCIHFHPPSTQVRQEIVDGCYLER